MTKHAHMPRSPKFTDSFERALANDIDFHLRRSEPSALKPALQAAGAAARRLVAAILGLSVFAPRGKVSVRAC